MNFTHRTFLVTGAARGLGLAYARALAERGARVVITDRGADRAGCGTDPGPVERAAQALQAAGHQVLGHRAELADEAVCEALVARTVEQFGGLDGVIHNAGWVGYQPIEQVDAGFVERALAINVQAPLWLCKHAWPHLKASAAPRVVLTTSDRAMYACYAQTGLAAYAAGKMAQLGIMNALSEEGAAHGILVNAVSPVARTRMWGEEGEPDDLKPEWVVPGVVYLVSDACQVTGQVLRASNGQFVATRFEEQGGVTYPRDLRGVEAQQPEQVAQCWAAHGI